MSRCAVCFCMPETGHFQRLRPLLAGLAQVKVGVHVFTHRRFAADVKRAGGTFHDLFAKYPLEQADDTSLPVPCRFVTFAGTFAGQIRREVEKLRPSLVVHDSFAVIGRVMASLLHLPRVNLCAGHNVTPDHFLGVLQTDPRVKVSVRCHEAVEVLRERYGLADASPFSYVGSPSEDLNLYAEPPEFLELDERRRFEPVAFYGSLPEGEGEVQVGRARRSRFGRASGRKLKVFVSFGTVVWRYYAGDAIRALATLATAFSRREDVRTVISLGGVRIDGSQRDRLHHANVAVLDYVDQWQILREADVFVTHHGLNSTHEAIYCRVPMLSYPFFWDQPGLAEKCRKFGLAIPLSGKAREEIGLDRATAALDEVVERRASMMAALDRARAWEESVMAARPAVHRRIAGILDGATRGPVPCGSRAD
jgi:UDP:flavonoid glycosyltransferase YjiC (YdhE family)